MSTKSKLQQSRNRWKEKAVSHTKGERYLRKENYRIKKERNQYKKDFKETKAQLKKEQHKNTLRVSDKEDLVYIALQLFMVARIGFQAIHRVLDVLGCYLGLEKVPCTQTVINWVTRLSISRIKNASQLVGPQVSMDPFSNGFIFMIDISIGLGAGKILAILALDANHHVLNKGAPNLQNVHCVGVSVADSWTGETIADFLQKVIAAMGRPAAFLKDGGKDLAKAVRILDERSWPSCSIDDISHIVANLLKHEYENHPMFDIFISSCGKVSTKLKQTLLACLAPPKISTKARFMNLHRLVKWADQLLKHSPKGRASKGSLLSKLRASFNQIPECKTFIKHFIRDANPLLECQKILKTKGLSQNSYRECQHIVEAIPLHSPVRLGFVNWAEKQLSVAKNLGLDNTGMPISSDAIESLFGVTKQHGTGEVKDANRMALRIPAMCGKLTRYDAHNVLNISVKEQQKVENSLPSLIKQRKQVLPNPGSLNEIQHSNTMQNLELIPESKKRTNNTINIDYSGGYKRLIGPSINIKNNAIPHAKTDICQAIAA